MSRPIVRRATLDDVARFVELGLRFYDEEGGREVCPHTLARFALSHVSDENRVYLAAGDPVAASAAIAASGVTPFSQADPEEAESS